MFESNYSYYGWNYTFIRSGSVNALTNTLKSKLGIALFVKDTLLQSKEMYANETQIQQFDMICKSKKGGKDQESIQSSTTPVPGYHI